MTVYARGIDYAWQHPDPKAIKDAGFDFVCRYYSRDPSKNLTRQEAEALASAGLWIVGNWEHTAQDALGGAQSGVANAQLARSLADGCGQPAARPIYESDDWDVTPQQEPTVTAYLRAWDAEIGVAETGEYGGYYPLKVQRDAGVTSWEWQTRAWSGGQWEPRVNIRQVGTATIGGVQVDVNEAWTPDYGQWQPGRLPTLTTAQEVLPMEFIANVAPDPANPSGAIGDWLWTADGTYVGIASPDDLIALDSLGIKTIGVSFEMHKRLYATQAKSTPSTITGSVPLTISGTGTISAGAAG